MEAQKKVMTGVVVSDKMDKTIVVEVTSRNLHPLYKKYVISTKKFKAHDEKNDAMATQSASWNVATCPRTSAGDSSKLSRELAKGEKSWYRCRLI